MNSKDFITEQVNLYPKTLFFFLMILLLLIYSSTFYLPYLLLDENWLLRSINLNLTYTYPTLDKYVSITQGRPVFAILLYVSRLLANFYSQIIAIQVLRIAAIIGLSVFVFQIYKLALRIKMPIYFSLPLALSLVALPSFQVLVSDATWLVVPLLLATWSFLINYDAVIKNNKTTPAIFWGITLCTLSLATYQSLILINISLLLFIYLFGYNEISINHLKKLFLRTAIIVICSLVIYYILWRLAYYFIIAHHHERRYAPHNISLKNFRHAFHFFINFRLKQALNFWSVYALSNLYQIPLIVIITAFLIKGVTFTKQVIFKAKPLFSLKFLLAALAGICISLLLSDAVTMSAPGHIQSYTTLVALSVSCYFVFYWAFLTIFSYFTSWLKFYHHLPAAILTLLCAGSLLFAQNTTLMNFSLPNWVLANLVEDTIQETIKNNHTIGEIVVHQAERPLRNLYTNQATQEFNWLNFGASFYTYWHLRNLFDQMQKEIPKVTFIYANNSDPNIVMPNPFAPQKGKKLIFDFRKEALTKSLIKQ